MKLVYDETGIEVKINDEAMINGEKVVIVSIEKPHKPSSTGRVYVKVPGLTMSQSYFPSVIGAHWIDREDQR